MNRYFYKVIGDVVSAASAKQMCEALDKCRDILRSRFANREGFMEQLQSSVKKQAAYYKYGAPAVKVLEQPAPNVFIYEDRMSYLVYSSFIINSCRGIRELDEQIAGIIDFFGNRITEPRTDMLSTCEINELLDIVQEKYGLIDTVTDGKELEIYAMNRSHVCYDSLLLTFKNTRTGTLLNKWMVFSLSPCFDIPACNKYFVFLHEIGHILYNEITCGGNTVPEMFREIAESLGLPFADDDNRLSELFADIFSASSLNKTRYCAYNPFNTALNGKMLELFELYFRMLTYRMNRQSGAHHEGQTFLH